MEKVIANNTKTTYLVLNSRTADDTEAKHPNTASIMRKNGIKRLITAKRPNGTKRYELVEYANSTIHQIASF